MSVPRKLKPIDITPTWAAVAHIIELGFTECGGSKKARLMARDELARMARILDEIVESKKGM